MWISPSKPIRAAFVGCGTHATENIYPVVHRAGVDLVAVCDISTERAQRNARWFGAERYYTDFVQMLADERDNLEALFVVVGPAQHHALGKMALEAGLHLWTEKPPAARSDQALELWRLADSKSLIYMPGFMKRFATANRLAKEATMRQEFGRLRQYEARYTASPYSDDESFFLHHVVHHADLVRFYLGDLRRLLASRVEVAKGRMGYQVLVESVDGASGVITVNSLESWGSPNERLALVGDGHFIEVNNGRLFWHRKTPIRGQLDEPNLNMEHDALAWEQNLSWATTYSNRGYEGEILAFADAVRGDDPATPNGRDGWLAMVTAEAIQTSARSGQWVDLPLAPPETDSMVG